MTPNQVEQVQHGAKLIGRFERRGRDALLNRVFEGNDGDAARVKNASDSLILYAVVVAQRLSQLRDVSFAEALEVTRSFDSKAIPAELNWTATADLMKMLSGGTTFGAVAELTKPAAFATGFNIALALTRELAAEEGKRTKDVADEIGVMVEDPTAVSNLFDPQTAWAASLVGAQDPAAMQRRRVTSELLVDRCAEAGEVLLAQAGRFQYTGTGAQSAFGHGDDRLATLGYLCLGVSSLGAAIVELVENNPYPAWGLLRQLVEMEYLAWAFAEDNDEAAAWLQSTKEERTSQFSPRHVYRKATNSYRGQDYQLHCDLGGHPTPVGLQLLRREDPRVVQHALCEFINHGSSIWHYVVVAAARLADEHGVDQTMFIASGIAAAIDTAVNEWRLNEPTRYNIQLLAGTVDTV